MTTTPRLWKSQTQVNTSDAPVAPGGASLQGDGQIARLPDGGYLVVWTDLSRTYNANGDAVVGQRYDSAGNKVGGEIYISHSFSENQFAPAVTVLSNGNIAVAFVDRFDGPSIIDSNILVRVYDPALNYIRTDVIDAGTNQTIDPSLTAFSDGNYVVSYTLSNSASDSDIVARVVTSATGLVGHQFDIENQTDNRETPQLATLSNGNFVAVYEDEFSRQRDRPRHQVRDLHQDRHAGAFAVNPSPGVGNAGLETDPDVAALRDGGFVVVWTDPDTPRPTFGRRSCPTAGATVASNILVNTTTAGTQDHANVVALADGGFLVSWRRRQHQSRRVRSGSTRSATRSAPSSRCRRRYASLRQSRSRPAHRWPHRVMPSATLDRRPRRGDLDLDHRLERDRQRRFQRRRHRRHPVAERRRRHQRMADVASRRHRQLPVHAAGRGMERGRQLAISTATAPTTSCGRTT